MCPVQCVTYVSGRSSPIYTRPFSLFPFSVSSLKKPFCQPFVNFTISRMPLHSGVPMRDPHEPSKVGYDLVNLFDPRCSL
jgi:hypothetical protein